MWLSWWLLWAIVPAIVAAKRGRSWPGWFLLGLVLSFVALVILMCLPNRRLAAELDRDGNA
jgi:hypothetical protein